MEKSLNANAGLKEETEYLSVTLKHSRSKRKAVQCRIVKNFGLILGSRMLPQEGVIPVRTDHFNLITKYIDSNYSCNSHYNDNTDMGENNKIIFLNMNDEAFEIVEL